jgi:GTP-binding protein
MIRIVDSNYIKSAVNQPDYPELFNREIAFAGKSNVGKSSMINTITGRKLLAKTSGTPGKTRLINFFDIRCKYSDPNNIPAEETDLNFTLVDLPGYGYAKVSHSERIAWQKMIENYLRKREQLSGIVVLVDIRHKADPKDIDMIEFVKKVGIPFLIVATKADKIPNNKVPSYLKDLKTSLNIKTEQIAHFSSHTKKGVTELNKWIESLLVIQKESGKVIIHD